MQKNYDVLIIGGGLAGNCLALALYHSDLKVAIVEAHTREQLHHSPAGDRALALSSGSVILLKSLGIWQAAKKAATPIANIHISDQGHFGKTRLSARKEKVSALGYVIAARDLEDVVAHLVEQANIEQICPASMTGITSDESFAHVSLKQGETSLALSAKLVVGADGGQSSVRHLLGIEQAVTEYQQTAIVTTIKTTVAHDNTAFERFTPSGPLALLPFKDEYAVVWTRETTDAEQLMEAGDTVFIEALQACFGYKLGQFSLTAPKRSFPLRLIRAKQMFSGRAVIIGNAVHQLHPVAGQGFNLGLRDVIQLAELILKQVAKETDIGAYQVLETYAQQREKDHDTVIHFTNGVVKLFSNEWQAFALARNTGLTLLDFMPNAKQQLARYAMGFNARMPHIGKRRQA